MRISSATWIAAMLVAATAVLAAWAWSALPAGVPVNYLGFDGVRHLGSSRTPLVLMPLISALVLAGLTFAPNAQTRRAIERAPQAIDMTLIAVAGLLLVVEAALIGRGFDPAFNVMRPVAIASGVLLLASGNYLGKARQNAVFGLRTPWTLADANVWDRTHRFTGAGMVLGGLVLIGLGFALHDGNALGVSIGACTAVPILAGVIRSAGLHRRLQRG